MRTNKTMIPEELLASFMEGKTSLEDTALVLKALAEDEELQEEYILLKKLDAIMGENAEVVERIPLVALVADSDDNLCDFQCEQYILKRREIDFDTSILSEEAKSNRWLREKGTPLHSVGRILEQNDLIVMRRFGAEMKDVVRAINAGHDVIAVVNNSKLFGKKNEGAMQYHAVVVNDISDNNVVMYDPSSNREETCSIADFMKAWEDSKSYIARVKSKDYDYNPRPLDLEDVELSADLIDLREAIAENAHEIWADQRQEEGWIYGPKRDDAKKEHPDMVPYSMLPDSEKEYDRRMAFDTIKLMKKLGYDIVKHEDTPAYLELIGKLGNIESARACECGAIIFIDQIYCPHCGKRLDWKTFK